MTDPATRTATSETSVDAEAEAAETGTHDSPGTPEAPDTRRRWCWGTRLLVSGTAAWAAFLLAHMALIGRWWLWQFAEALPPLTFALVPLLLLGLSPLARPVRRWLPAVIAALLVIGVPLGGFVPGERATGQVSASDLRVFAWNTLYWDQDKDPEAFYDYLEDQDADVYLLQEYLHWRLEGPVRDGPLRIDAVARLREHFPGYEVIAEGELITLTRLPVVATHPRPTGGGTDWYWQGKKAQRVDVRYAGRTVSLYNVHLQVPFRTDLSPLSGEFYGFMREQFDAREDELDELRADLADNAHPALVTGDFNSPWLHYSGLASGLRRIEPGSGILPRLSWPVSTEEYALPTLWRLDWAFASEGLTVTSYELRDSQGLSDHRAQEFRLAVA